MVKNKLQSLLQQSKIILLIFISLAILMISSALIELNQSKKDLFGLMKEESHTLLESLLKASQNSLLANQYLTSLTRARFIDNANMVKILYNNRDIYPSTLRRICQENHIEDIYLYNRQGKIILSGNNPANKYEPDTVLLKKMIQPVLTGQTDTLFLGPKKFNPSSRLGFVVALSMKQGGAVVLNMTSVPFRQFRKEVGFGPLIRNVAAANPHIIYIALQNEDDILAATGKVDELEPISQSEFLSRSLHDSVVMSRIAHFGSLDVFESVHPYTFHHHTLGLLRLGLSIEPINIINKRILRRMVMITIILIIIGVFMFTFIFTRQRFDLLQKRYQLVETYSSNIIENVSDAIIVFDEEGAVRIFNQAAREIFGISKKVIERSGVDSLFPTEDFNHILEQKSALHQLNFRINGQLKYLLVSKSSFLDAEKKKYTILVIRDLTDQKLMEKQIERKERLTAMGELASGVAHEIRNPLNAISTIVQQIKKDFEPKEDVEEYHELMNIVYGEVKRINQTIQDFLRFARPEPVNTSQFKISNLIHEIQKQYETVAKEHNIKLNIDLQWDGMVQWDKNQIKQVFINIIQNAIDAINNKGNITIALHEDNEDVVITITDDGPGMDDTTKDNIFNLYFTTKAKGTGIGLSIVQRIIFEHGGVISVESKPRQGTSFIIRLPKKAGNDA